MKKHLDFLARLKFSPARANIIAAPMNGGFNTPAFCAAVINAGGVASFGFTYHSPDKIVSDVSETRELTNGGIINANFFVFEEIDKPTEDLVLVAAKDISRRLGIPQPDIYPVLSSQAVDRDAQIEAIWKAEPDLLTFHFGLPPKEVVREAKKRNILIGITATSVEEAMLVQESDADFIVAQGVEAGGHRGTFNTSLLRKTHDEMMGTSHLVKILTSINSKVTLPIIAAGGIMSGLDIFNMQGERGGAIAVQLGTAFLPCIECGTSSSQRRYLLSEPERETVFTTAFSGRAARGIQNKFISCMVGANILPFPFQNTLTGPIRANAAKDNDGELMSLWVGSQYGKARKRIPPVNSSHSIHPYVSVSELIQQLNGEFNACK